MMQAREPSIPALPGADGARLSSMLRELARTLLRSGLFLLRPRVTSILVPRPGADNSLRWGDLNRVFLNQDSTVPLPRIESETVGVPLEFVFLNAPLYTLTLIPSGLGLDRQQAPLINGAASVNLNTLGIFTLKNDGQNWFFAVSP
jgi:hypothetical protein